MSVKKIITFITAAVLLLFFFRLQDAAQTATSITYYSTQSVQLRHIQLVPFPSTREREVHCWWLKSSVQSVPSVFVDPKYPYSVKLRQLWEDDAKKGGCVDEEMRGIIFGVETGEDIQNNW